MTNEQYERITKAFDELNDKTMFGKGKEYSSEDDRMWNLNCVAIITSLWLEMKVKNQDSTVTPADAAWLLSLKHEVSIIKILAENKPTEAHILQEKFGDKAIYNKLTHANLHDTIANPNEF